MSAFETIDPKTKAQFEVFGHELANLLTAHASSSPHYQEILHEFFSVALREAPSTHKAFEKAIIAAINAKDAEEKAAREKAEGKQKGLKKFDGKVTATYNDDADEEETAKGGTTQEVYDDAELERRAKAEDEERLKEIARNTALAKSLREEELRRAENERMLEEKKRAVDAAAVSGSLEAKGYTVVLPAWDDGRKKKKGR